MLEADHVLDSRVAELLTEKRTIIEASVGASAVVEPLVVEVPKEVDLTAIVAASQQRIADENKARAEAARIAAERAADGAKLREQRAAEQLEQKAREKAAEKERKARERAKARGWIEDEDHPDRHAPRTAPEQWAGAALLSLSASDPDRAHDDNGIGFNKGDSFLGHWLCLELPRGLTTGQWQLAIKMCRKYHAQVGRCPIAVVEQPAETP
jgi:hypothetical protein